MAHYDEAEDDRQYYRYDVAMRRPLEDNRMDGGGLREEQAEKASGIPLKEDCPVPTWVWVVLVLLCLLSVGLGIGLMTTNKKLRAKATGAFGKMRSGIENLGRTTPTPIPMLPPGPGGTTPMLPPGPPGPSLGYGAPTPGYPMGYGPPIYNSRRAQGGLFY